MTRRIKHIDGKKEGAKKSLPIKEPKTITRIFDYWIYEREHAKSDIKKYQAYRNYMLFLIGFNTAFRCEDLLQLRVCDVEKGYISIKENKTGKTQNFRMNKNLYEQVLDYIKEYELKGKDYLFMGQKKKDRYKDRTFKIIYPITQATCDDCIFPRTVDACGIDVHFTMHSLRKTFGYQYIKNGGNPMTLMKMYNHENVGITMRYVMWDTDDAEQTREATFIGKKVK